MQMKRKPVKKERDTERNWMMREMRKQGKTYAEIGRLFKVSRQRVHQIVENDKMFDAKKERDIIEKEDNH